MQMILQENGNGSGLCHAGGPTRLIFKLVGNYGKPEHRARLVSVFRHVH